MSKHGITALTKYRVLVKPEHDDGTITTPTGFTLIKPDETTDRDKHAIMEGELIEKSPLAFQLEGWPDDSPVPEVGDWVVFAKFSGAVIKGNDGEEYRLMNDDDVVCVRHKDAGTSPQKMRVA